MTYLTLISFLFISHLLYVSSKNIMTSVNFNTVPILEKSFFKPELNDVAKAISDGLPSTFEEVKVEVVDCPDLTKAPFGLTSSGLRLRLDKMFLSLSQPVSTQFGPNSHPERVLHYQLVRADRHDCRALLSDSHLRIITCRDADTPHVLVEAHLDNIVSCSAVSSGDAHFVELGLKGSGGAEALRRPRVQCDSFELAEQLQRQVALAKDLHYEERHTLQTHPDLAQL